MKGYLAISLYLTQLSFIALLQYLFGLIIAAVIWQLIRAAKRGKSSRWLYNWCYWYLPTELFRVVYRVIPDSSFRKWIK
ncbi:type IV conjugative transfer system protein TraL [Klebsiella quasipneumoniae]